MLHALKTWPDAFKAIQDGVKPYKLRKLDRPFRVGDRLVLQEWDPETKMYSGKEIHKKIVHILTGDGPYPGLYKGYGILALEDLME